MKMYKNAIRSLSEMHIWSMDVNKASISSPERGGGQGVVPKAK